MITKETYHLPCPAETVYQTAVHILKNTYPKLKLKWEEYVPSLLSCAVAFTSTVTYSKISFSIHVTKKGDSHCFFTITCINLGGTVGYTVQIDQIHFMKELMKELGIEGTAQEV